jgi:hypothetical protein
LKRENHETKNGHPKAFFNPKPPQAEGKEEKTDLEDNLKTLAEMRIETIQGGGPDQIEVQHRKGKLTVRKRLDLLLNHTLWPIFGVGFFGGRRS